MKNIPQRELRNRMSRVLREVEAGQPMRITVNGRPVADLVPIRAARRTFVPREELAALMKGAALDRSFRKDLASVADATIEDL